MKSPQLGLAFSLDSLIFSLFFTLGSLSLDLPFLLGSLLLSLPFKLGSRIFSLLVLMKLLCGFVPYGLGQSSHQVRLPDCQGTKLLFIRVLFLGPNLDQSIVG